MLRESEKLRKIEKIARPNLVFVKM